MITPAYSTFSIERTFPDAAPARVFAAFASSDAKARWFDGPPGWTQELREMDFRPGGHERLRGKHPGGKRSDFQAHYHDIVEGERIVYAYDMYVNEEKLSVSLATLLIEPAGRGTRLTLTEQGVYFAGADDAKAREQGTRGLLELLGASLAR